MSFFCSFPLPPQNECFLSQTEQKRFAVPGLSFSAWFLWGLQIFRQKKKREDTLSALFCHQTFSRRSGISSLLLCSFHFVILLNFSASNLYPPHLSMSHSLFFHCTPCSASLLIPILVFLSSLWSVLLSFLFIFPQLLVFFPSLM